MKRILSLVLCLALVFSVCIFSLTANAADSEDFCRVGYCFNNDSILVKFALDMTNFEFTGYSMNIFTDPDAIESEKMNTQVVEVPGTYDLAEIFEEYLPNSDLLVRFDDYYGRNTCNFSKNYTVSEYFSERLLNMFFRDKGTSNLDEYDIANIILYVNSASLLGCYVISDSVEDISPIVDSLMSTCKDSLVGITFECDKVNTIDNRLFTEFPNMRSKGVSFEGCNVCSFKDPSVITFGRIKGIYYYKLTQKEYDEARNNSSNPKTRLQWIFEEKILPNIDAPENAYHRDSVLTTGGSVSTVFYYTYNDIRARIGTFRFSYVVQADPTKDNVVDSFDVAMTTEYVNTFEEPEDEAVMTAMDVVADGFIDATDLAYVSYIANFEG